MNPEKGPQMPSPEEMAKNEEKRTLSDAELLNGGAEYEINEKGEKRLELTAEQIEKAKEEMETEQNNIAHEYLQEYKHWIHLDHSYQNKLKILDKLREEIIDPKAILDTENELKNISVLMDGSQKYQKSLFNKLSDESKEKYLKNSREEE